MDITHSPHGKVALITGGTSGIGLETALGLARMGMQVAIVGQDQPRLDAAMKRLLEQSGNPHIQGFRVDLASQKEVQHLAEMVLRRYDRLDVLINNAGIWLTKPDTTVDGIEKTWAVNHLAMVQLTLALLPLLGGTHGARIVNVASRIHHSGKISPDDLKGNPDVSGRAAYARSKLANVMFTYALSRRVIDLGISVNALHPGVIASGLWRHMGLIGRIIQIGMISAQEGAGTTLYLATRPEIENASGQYFSKGKLATSSALSQNVAMQEALWGASMEQLGISNQALLPGLNSQD